MVFQWRSFLAGVLVGSLVVTVLSLLLFWPDAPERASFSTEASETDPETVVSRSGLRSLRDRLEDARPVLRETDLLSERPLRTPATLRENAQQEFGREVGDRAGPRPGSDEKWFDAKALFVLGVPDHEIDRIEDVWQRYFMNRIRIENERARQKGKWKEAAELKRMNATQAREELGDEAFDAMLYAGGERNRVFLSQLLQDSPGEAAGLMPGDELISYDDERIFRPAEIRNLTSEGSRDEWVEVQVLRDGELRRFFVLRGPIGAQLEFRSRPPFELP